MCDCVFIHVCVRMKVSLKLAVLTPAPAQTHPRAHTIGGSNFIQTIKSSFLFGLSSIMNERWVGLFKISDWKSWLADQLVGVVWCLSKSGENSENVFLGREWWEWWTTGHGESVFWPRMVIMMKMVRVMGTSGGLGWEADKLKCTHLLPTPCQCDQRIISSSSPAY